VHHPIPDIALLSDAAHGRETCRFVDRPRRDGLSEFARRLEGNRTGGPFCRARVPCVNHTGHTVIVARRRRIVRQRICPAARRHATKPAHPYPGIDAFSVLLCYFMYDISGDGGVARRKHNKRGQGNSRRIEQISRFGISVWQWRERVDVAGPNAK